MPLAGLVFWILFAPEEAYPDASEHNGLSCGFLEEDYTIEKNIDEVLGVTQSRLTTHEATA